MRSSPTTNELAIFTRMFSLTCVLVLSAVAVMAQATTGSLRGTVTDANGGVLAGATVTVKNEATGSTSPAIKTGGEGTFDVSALQPGNYTVTVEASGFKRSVSTGVAVKIGIVNPVAVVLEAGSVAETVTVTADSETIVQRDQSQISTTVSTRQVQDLPSNGAGSGLDTLALLAPGVINQRSTGANTNGTGLSVNGNRGRSNNFQIDGADNNDLTVTGPALFVDFQDQVQEYQVITNNFSAQYGRNQGAIVNIVTKGGTNTFHGTAFDFHQDARNLNSLNNTEKRSGQLKPNRSLLNVFGGTFGGPLYLPRFGEGGKSIWKGTNRAFFFFGYQGVRNPSTFTGSTTSLAVLDSEFPRLTATFPTNNLISTYTRYSPFAITLRGRAKPNTFVSGTGVPSAFFFGALPTGCSTRAIPIGGAPPTACAAVPYAPFINPATGQAFLTGGPYDTINLGTLAAPILFQAAQYERTVSTPYVENYSNLRFDFKATSKDSLTFRYLKQVQQSVAGTGSTSGGWLGDVPATSKHYGADWTHTFGSNLVTEFRPNYQAIGVKFGGGCSTGDPGCISDPLDLAVNLANISFSGALGLTKSNALGTIGPATNLPQGRVGKVYQFPVNVSYSAGRHSWIFGGEYKKLTEILPFLPNANGAYGFSSAARITSNAPSSVSITLGEPVFSFKENDEYFYAQDDFKLRPNLTLNLGLRYEYTGQPINQLHDVSVARESNAATAFFNPALPLAIRTVPQFPVDKNNWAPRFGFAYSPHFWKKLLGEDATVIRGGFSIAYDAAFYNILLNVSTNAPFAASLTIPSSSLPASGSPAPLPANPTGDVVRASAQASGVLPKGVLNPIFLSQTTVAPDFRAPYAEQWSLGIQHQFGRRHVAEVRYVGTHGVALFQNVNANFFNGPLVNGFNVTRNAGGSLVRCSASPTTPCLNARSFANLLPAGTVTQVCVDNPATLDLENACNDRQFPQGGKTVRANTSQSIYHSLQSRYNGRFFKDSVNLGLSYAWSKAIDDASDIFARTDIQSPSAQNPYCINRCERSLSAVDRPHAFSANFIWDVPYFREQRGVVGHLLGGWQFNGTYFLTSGATFTPGQNSTFNSATGNSYLTAGDRPFLTNPGADRRLVGINAFDAFLLGKISATQLASFGQTSFLSLTQLNATGAAVAVTPGDVKYVLNGPGAAQVFGSPFGSSGRNVERGPIFNQLNMGVFKNIKVYERLTVQLRGEAFNILNHPTPGVGNVVGGGYLPAILVTDAGVSSAAFGENQDITFARRVVQVGLRIVF